MEIVLFWFSLLFMVARMQANSVWFLIIGIVHPARALIGIYISRSVPRSFSDLLDDA